MTFTGNWASNIIQSAKLVNPFERKREELRQLWSRDRDPRLGWEQNNDVVRDALIIGNNTLPIQQRFEAQERLNALLYTDGPAVSGGGGGSGPSIAQQAAGIKAELENLAGLFGIAPQDWTELSFQAAQNNWNAAMIRDAVADRIDMAASAREGIVKNIITKSRDVGANYFVNVGDEEALGWAKRIARGEMEEESIVASIRDRAKAQYYWLANAIDSGVSLKEYFQPHRETIAKMMEVSPDSIDFVNNSKWNKVLRYMPPDQEGVREMNLGEVEQYVRSQEEWKATSNAKSSAAAAAVTIGQIFGAL